MRVFLMILLMVFCINAHVQAAEDKKNGVQTKPVLKKKPPAPKKTEKVKPTKPEDEEEVKVAVYFAYGEHSSALRPLTTALFERCRSCSDSLNLGIVGGGVYWIFQPVLVELEAYSIGSGSFDDSEFSTVIGANMGVINFGWNFSPFEWFRFYPILGMGLGTAVVEFNNQRKITNFADYVANPGQNGKLTNTMLLLNMGIGTDIKIEFDEDFGMLFGTRLGYMISSDSSEWESGGNGTTILGGPVLDMSGPYFKILMGF